jgi:hypothetical protein
MDQEEGADILMVNPGLAYLDIVRDLKNQVMPDCSIPGLRRICHDQGRRRKRLGRIRAHCTRTVTLIQAGRGGYHRYLLCKRSRFFTLTWFKTPKKINLLEGVVFDANDFDAFVFKSLVYFKD